MVKQWKSQECKESDNWKWGKASIASKENWTLMLQKSENWEGKGILRGKEKDNCKWREVNWVKKSEELTMKESEVWEWEEVSITSDKSPNRTQRNKPQD